MASFKTQFSDVFELPEEILLDAPLIMLVGKRKIYLENHKGIALYQKDLIKVRVKSGILIIKGDKLKIEEIESENIYIQGKINELAYEARG